jgi:glycosyltransferase involved in cell wall biosynthesis
MYFNKFTILIPTRERSETLFHTIRTCLNQTYQNFQVVIFVNNLQSSIF